MLFRQIPLCPLRVRIRVSELSHQSLADPEASPCEGVKYCTGANAQMPVDFTAKLLANYFVKSAISVSRFTGKFSGKELCNPNGLHGTPRQFHVKDITFGVSNLDAAVCFLRALRRTPGALMPD